MLKPSEVTPEERSHWEEKATRSLRRGALRDAIAALGRIADAFPGDEGVRARVREIEASLQPEEASGRVSPVPSEPSSIFATPAQEAEALASRGDFAAAIAIYRRLAQAHPDSQLVAERLTELFQLAMAKAHRPPTDKRHLLEHLLERIASRRRG